MKHTRVLLLAAIFSLIAQAAGLTPACQTSLPAAGKNVAAVVSDCENTGSFSLGGLYKGRWEKLTYLYPRPWAGTFITVNVDGKLYTTSKQPADGILMDNLTKETSSISAGLLTTKWLLPENIVVEQTLQHQANSTFIKILAVNHATKNYEIGVRIHFDTLIGLNDGAPIYVPGDGLKTTEKSYSSPSFKYWKAYNRPTEPTIVATGTLDPALGLAYPSKVVIADWKKSKNTAWDYTVDETQSILGDSAVLLYYNPQPIPPEGSFTILTGYGVSEPVLAEEKGFFGLTELLLDNIHGTYCPGNVSTITVDVLSVNTSNRGTILLEVVDGGKTIDSMEKTTGDVAAEQIKSVGFKWVIPQTKSGKKYTLKATLKNQSGDTIDDIIRENLMQVDLSRCAVEEKQDNRLWLLIPAILILLLSTAALILIYYTRKQTVEIQKTVDERGLVKVTVKNKTRNKITDCIVEDRIPTQAEVDVKTLQVMRKDNRLVWNVGELTPGSEAVLEYSIRGVSVLPPARVSWNNGEAITE